MTLDEKREKLRRYLLKRDSLQRKCREVGVWEELTGYQGGGIVRADGRRRSPDSIKETAIALRQECESLAGEVAELRRELGAAFDQLEGDAQRDILEKKYLEGMSNAQLAEELGCCVRQVRRLVSSAIMALARESDYFTM